MPTFLEKFPQDYRDEVAVVAETEGVSLERALMLHILRDGGPTGKHAPKDVVENWIRGLPDEHVDFFAEHGLREDFLERFKARFPKEP